MARQCYEVQVYPQGRESKKIQTYNANKCFGALAFPRGSDGHGKPSSMASYCLEL